MNELETAMENLKPIFVVAGLEITIRNPEPSAEDIDEGMLFLQEIEYNYILPLKKVLVRHTPERWAYLKQDHLPECTELRLLRKHTQNLRSAWTRRPKIFRKLRGQHGKSEEREAEV